MYSKVLQRIADVFAFLNLCNFRRPVLVGCALLFGCMVIGCDKTEDPADPVEPSTVVRAADGSATLTIPDSAMPDGVSAADIVIERADNQVDPFDGSARFWTFSPSGLVFKQAVSLELAVDIGENVLFSVDHFANGALESPDVEISQDDTTRRITSLTTTMNHFSTVAVFTHENSTVWQEVVASWTQPAFNAGVNHYTSGAAEFEPPESFAFAITWLDPITNVGWRKEISWSNSSVWDVALIWGATYPPLSPSIKEDDITGVGTLPAGRDFRCFEVAPFEIKVGYLPTFEGQYVLTNLDSGVVTSGPENFFAVGYLTCNANCLDKDPKSEFLAQQEALELWRLEALGVPGISTVNLSDYENIYGFTIVVGPNATIAVSVNTANKAAVTYYPEFSPGFDFTNIAPGTTTVTNRDATYANRVLVVLEGSETLTIAVE